MNSNSTHSQAHEKKEKACAIKDAEWEVDEPIRNLTYDYWVSAIRSNNDISICFEQLIYGDTKKQCKSKVLEFFKINGISKYKFL